MSVLCHHFFLGNLCRRNDDVDNNDSKTETKLSELNDYIIAAQEEVWTWGHLYGNRRSETSVYYRLQQRQIFVHMPTK